jgi:DHA2 family multidrug resistance protein
MTSSVQSASAAADMSVAPANVGVASARPASVPLQPPAGAAATQPFGARVAIGLFGIYIAAMTAGLNNRVAALALADVRGALGFGADQSSWLSTVYTAGELVAMPFAAWFAITLSLRRFHLAMLAVCTALAVALPFIRDMPLLLVMRGLQGIASGTLIPLLMMAALRFLPAPIRLHGFALYSMTATFAPNLAIWFAGQWVDQFFDWRIVYWQIIPLSLLSMGLVAWGMPQDPLRTERFAQADWFGFACGVVGLSLLVVALDQGVRLDWFNSPAIVARGW